MLDFRCGNPTNDFDFDSEGNLIEISGDSAMAQRLQIRLSILEGQWFLDTRIGIPWLKNVLVRNPNIPEIRAIFESEILSDPEIDELDFIRVDFNAQIGRLNIQFGVTTVEGDTFEAEAVSENWGAVISLISLSKINSIVG
jgi:hypothetical protein